MKKMFFILICAIVFQGCAMLSSTVETRFSITENFVCDEWQISVFDGESVEEFSLADGDKSFSLILPKNVALGVLAYPLKNGKKQVPVGTIYPYNFELDLKKGFASHVLDRLYRSSTDAPGQVQDFVSRFNWKKFIELVTEFENPWDLDCERIVKAIAHGNFKKTDLKLVGK